MLYIILPGKVGQQSQILGAPELQQQYIYFQGKFATDIDSNRFPIFSPCANLKNRTSETGEGDTSSMFSIESSVSSPLKGSSPSRSISVRECRACCLPSRANPDQGFRDV